MALPHLTLTPQKIERLFSSAYVWSLIAKEMLLVSRAISVLFCARWCLKLLNLSFLVRTRSVCVYFLFSFLPWKERKWRIMLLNVFSKLSVIFWAHYWSGVGSEGMFVAVLVPHQLASFPRGFRCFSKEHSPPRSGKQFTLLNALSENSTLKHRGREVAVLFKSALINAWRIILKFVRLDMFRY